MAEGGGLLNRYTVNIRIVGSNPIPSATLSDAAVAVLEAAGVRDAAPERPLFPSPKGGGPLSNNAMRKLVQEDMRYAKRATPHGFRSTFRDWAGDCAEYERDLAELALAHTLPDKVEAAYRRAPAGPKRRRRQGHWAAVGAGERADNVAQLDEACRRAASQQ